MTPTPIAKTAAALALVSAVTLSACAGGSAVDADPSDDGKLKVVATTTQLTNFTNIVGGDDIALTGLLTAGASAHHFDPSPKELLELGIADVLIVNGAELEGFISSAIEASGFSGELITAADGIDLAEAERITEEASHESESEEEHAAHAGEADHAEHDDHADATEAEAEHAEHAEEAAGHDDHDHGPVNPHLWTSPRYASDMTAEIARGLAVADPDNAADYTERAEAYEAQLALLDEWISTEISKVPSEERVLVSGHDSLRYYLHDYEIAFAGAIIPSFEDNAEPSAAQIDALVERIRERGVQAVFVESSMSPKLARTIAREAGITVMDEDSLYADSLGTEGSGAETYLAATIHNTRLILEAWGETPGPVPVELEPTS